MMSLSCHASMCVRSACHFNPRRGVCVLCSRLVSSVDVNLGLNLQEAIENKKPISLEMDINNLDRTTGTILSYEISSRYGEFALSVFCM